MLPEEIWLLWVSDLAQHPVFCFVRLWECPLFLYPSNFPEFWVCVQHSGFQMPSWGRRDKQLSADDSSQRKCCISKCVLRFHQSKFLMSALLFHRLPGHGADKVVLLPTQPWDGHLGVTDKGQKSSQGQAALFWGITECSVNKELETNLTGTLNAWPVPLRFPGNKMPTEQWQKGKAVLSRKPLWCSKGMEKNRKSVIFINEQDRLSHTALFQQKSLPLKISQNSPISDETPLQTSDLRMQAWYLSTK